MTNLASLSLRDSAHPLSSLSRCHSTRLHFYLCPSLNYPFSHSSNAIRRSSPDRHSHSPSILSRPVRHSVSTQSPHLQLFNHDVPDKSPTSALLLAGPSNPIHRETVRMDFGTLQGNTEIQSKREPGVCDSEEVERRVRAIARLERVGTKRRFYGQSKTQLASGANKAGEQRREMRCGMAMPCAGE